jgi:Uma2 family endonuclease
MKVMDKVQEVIEAPLSPEELAVRYREICEDPAFARVPGKVEIDLWGRTLMSPPAAPYHGRLQVKLADKLASLGGERTTEAAIATPLGLFVADLTWSSRKTPPKAKHDNPLMRAPELCIEVVSPSNSRKELREKTEGYLAAGAEEVWIVYPRSARCEVHTKHGLVERSGFPVDLADLFD